MADIVIVGGGPIGCWQAIQIKKRAPHLTIRIYERHEQYQRDHLMSINRASLLRHAKKTADAAEADFFAKIAAANNRPGNDHKASALSPVTYIRTLDFEAILKDYCLTLGIDVVYDKIASPQDAMERHPECQYFIAADGAHSAMRNALLGGEENSVIRKNLLHSIDVKYDTLGQAQYMRIPTYKKVSGIVIESIGSAKIVSPEDPLYARLAANDTREQTAPNFTKAAANGATPQRPAQPPLTTSTVALRFIVDQKAYDSLPEATFRAPLTLDQTPSFCDPIVNFQELRSRHTGEQRISGSEKITKITLSQYASKKFAAPVKINERTAHWFMAGDAAMGMPFYRSINSGLLLASQLAGIIASRSSGNAKSRTYNTLRTFKVSAEFGKVALKLAGIKTYKNVVRPVLRNAPFIIAAPIVLPIALGIALYSKINPKARLM